MKIQSTTIHSRPNKFRSALEHSLIYFPIILFYGMLFIYAVNVPSLDDFIAILGFMNQFVELNSFSEKLHLIFSQHNEHRIVFTRTLTLVNYYLGGSVNFKLLIVAGNLALLGLIFLIYRSSGTPTSRLLYFCPAVLFLFQPSYLESMLWAMAATSNFYVLFFSFLSIYLLMQGSHKSLIFSIIFAILASYTQGNGIFVFLSGLFLLLLQGKHQHGLIWGIVFMACLFIYFHGYEKPPPFPGVIEEPFNLANTARYFLLFVGSIGKYRGLANILGALILAVFLYLTYAKYYKSNPIIYAFLLFLLLTAISASLARANMGLGIGQALSSRYTINSALLLLLTYLALVELLAERFKFWMGASGGSIALAIFIFHWVTHGPFFKPHHDSLVHGVNQVKLGDNSGLNYPDKTMAVHILAESRLKGIYAAPDIDQ